MSCQNYSGKKGYSTQKTNISEIDAGNIFFIITWALTLSLPLSMVVTLRMGTISQSVDPPF